MKGSDEEMSVEQRINKMTQMNGVEPLTVKKELCWICNGWEEKTFRWVNYLSGPALQSPVYLHLNFLQFKPLLMVREQQYFILKVMCPANSKAHTHALARRC